VRSIKQHKKLEDGTLMPQHRRECLRHINGLLWPWPLTSRI